MRRSSLGMLALAILASAPAFAAGPEVDCRYSAPKASEETVEAEAAGRTVLPADDVFRPLLSDPKEPRFSASYDRIEFRSRGLPAEKHGEIINGSLVGFGSAFGLATMRRERSCDGIQLGVAGAVFSQFNLDTASSDLINSDFTVGLPLTMRRGPLSGRIRYYHQSSHLGDEFLLNNPEVDRVNLSFEAFDAIVSAEWSVLRAYGGGGVLVRTEPDLDRELVQWGVELRADPWPFELSERVRAIPVAGADWKAFAEHDWSVTTAVTGGFEIASVATKRRLRLVFVYLEGFLPFGQFFNTEEIESFGAGLQFEL